MSTAILLISCNDQKGITASITSFVFSNGGNIEHADQHIDKESNTFFMRIEWSLENFSIEKTKINENFKTLADKFNMHWSLYFRDTLPRMAIFVSRSLHCLHDLLLKYKQKYLNCQIPLIISNHRDAEEIAKNFDIPFFYSKKTPETKIETERKEIDLLKKEDIDVIALARYGQIFTGDFIKEFPNRIINIHHSFLPAFAGGDPYAQAWKKGVKIIGATSHYVIEKLDAGPIIEQDIVRITHRSSLPDLKREGQELERVVLGRAIRWHLERKILVYDNKTVLFD
jgi:formyltetrahydrofolate deformylase